MQVDDRIVVGNRGITDRAARWACGQVGRYGRTVSEVADELGCDWHTVHRAVIAYGLALVDDPDRIGTVTVLGIDETAFVRTGAYRRRLWSTQLVGDRQLLDVVPGLGDEVAACQSTAGDQPPRAGLLDRCCRAARDARRAWHRGHNVDLHRVGPADHPDNIDVGESNQKTAHGRSIDIQRGSCG